MSHVLLSSKLLFAWCSTTLTHTPLVSNSITVTTTVHLFRQPIRLSFLVSPSPSTVTSGSAPLGSPDGRSARCGLIYPKRSASSSKAERSALTSVFPNEGGTKLEFNHWVMDMEGLRWKVNRGFEYIRFMCRGQATFRGFDPHPYHTNCAEDFTFRNQHHVTCASCRITGRNQAQLQPNSNDLC